MPILINKSNYEVCTPTNQLPPKKHPTPLPNPHNLPPTHPRNTIWPLPTAHPSSNAPPAKLALAPNPRPSRASVRDTNPSQRQGPPTSTNLTSSARSGRRRAPRVTPLPFRPPPTAHVAVWSGLSLGVRPIGDGVEGTCFVRFACRREGVVVSDGGGFGGVVYGRGLMGEGSGGW